MALAAVVAVGCDGISVPPDVPSDGAVAADGDGDGDGVPTAMDCDDTDATISSSAARACTSDCATGAETCTDGAWTACSASADCACETPGEMRTVECGRCGVASQQCGADGRWEVPSECFDEQECFAGEVEQDTSMCGERARICDDTCEWRRWETVVEPGECEAGDVQRTSEGCDGGQTREQSCSEECVWEHVGMCLVSCTTSPAPSRSGADPVCIPAGPFILGWNESDEFNTRPSQMVMLSEFHVDRLPVTKARYEMCLADGGCTGPDDPTAYGVGGPDYFAAGLTWSQAVAFCEWDGGILINEFQWEKAARGAAPDERLRPWGDDVGDCRQHPWTGCEDLRFSVTAFPESVSPWGVRLMGSLKEWTNSGRRDDYFGLPATDPTGMPVEGEVAMVRGHEWRMSVGFPLDFRSESAVRRDLTRHEFSGDKGFRCVY